MVRGVDDRLSEVDVTVGQKFKAGDILARVDPTELQATLDGARATLDQQQASYTKTAAGATLQQAVFSQAQIDAARGDSGRVAEESASYRGEREHDHHRGTG